ncbi:MAG TPA: dTDP-4-dehydrorhamnose 3,5-epimerase [Thermodesulfobacteriota bacterium]|nr:dTDP-4-dehydrorhamnose 3,5-epimerase [Deltaproteobacteria bacterium]HNU72190.1 dTDP-4-dehydrorhamnose 3,5-epimerase [Thermodesulfobacteriota bacterium]
MTVTSTALAGLMIIDPVVFRDSRGCFLETYHQQKYLELGLPRSFVQDNHSHSHYGTLRGLHYQLHRPQGKLVYVVAGEIFDVAVDIRHGSPSFGQWLGITLSSENKRQMFIPEGFAHGFCVVSAEADVIYKCTDFYAPDDEYGILWSDPGIKIAWPITDPLISPKDSSNPELGSVPLTKLPVYHRT